MKYFFILFTSILIFSCTEKDKKKDIELNTYYADYLYIYNNYDSLGLDKSIKLLDEYIEEFPNAQNAYLLKAYFLTQNGNLDKTEAIFKEALLYDSTNVEVYVHWASLLLTDSTKIEKAKEINNIAKTIDTSNVYIENNETWIYLYEKDIEKALQNASNIVSLTNQSENTINRTLAVAAIMAKNDSIQDYAFSLLSKEDTTELNKLDAFVNGEVNLNALYNLLSK